MEDREGKLRVFYVLAAFYVQIVEFMSLGGAVEGSLAACVDGTCVDAEMY